MGKNNSGPVAGKEESTYRQAVRMASVESEGRGLAY